MPFFSAFSAVSPDKKLKNFYEIFKPLENARQTSKRIDTFCFLCYHDFYERRNQRAALSVSRKRAKHPFRCTEFARARERSGRRKHGEYPGRNVPRTRKYFPQKTARLGDRFFARILRVSHDPRSPCDSHRGLVCADVVRA